MDKNSSLEKLGEARSARASVHSADTSSIHGGRSDVYIAKMGGGDSLAAGTQRLTPMMRQYLDAKAQYPKAIVLFRMGDFFETFFEDAKTCAQILDIVLTARSKENDVPMAGVPHHALDSYLQRLIDAGKTVVLVDQIEDPKTAKGLVRRAVTRILSPGTYIDPKVQNREAHYLGRVQFEALAKGKRKPTEHWSLATVDVSTGEFLVTSGEGALSLADEIERLKLKEILIPEQADALDLFKDKLQTIKGTVLNWVEGKLNPSSEQRKQFAELYPAHEGLEVLIGERSLHAAIFLLDFVKETQLRREAQDVFGMPSLRFIRPLRFYTHQAGLVLDSTAREHLELFSARGQVSRTNTLMDLIDQTKTAMGARLIRSWLSLPLVEVNAIAERHDAVEWFWANPNSLEHLRRSLSELYDLERLVGRLLTGRIVPKDLMMLRNSLRIVPELKTFLKEAYYAQVTAEQNVPKDVEYFLDFTLSKQCIELLEKSVLEEPSNDIVEGDVFREGFDLELDRVVKLAKDGASLVLELEAKERERTKIPSLKIRYNRVFGYFIEVTRTHLSLVPKDYIRKQTTVNSERFFTEELKTLETEVESAFELRAKRTRELFDQLVNALSEFSPAILELSSHLAKLDTLSNLAFIAFTKRWSRPLVNTSLNLKIEEGRHPVIEALSDELKEEFIPNDLELDDAQRLLLITGPNMAGKSTIMRQTALIAILAQMGSFVPAKRAEIGIIDRIFTRVGASDELSKGRSTFMVEMVETAQILRQATPQSLVILDEIGRGTSTYDGLSIAWAVLEYLHDTICARTLFATHYHELTELAEMKAMVRNVHVSVREHKGQIIFLRRLSPGPTHKSFGVLVARLAGLPPEVLVSAERMLRTLEEAAHASKATKPQMDLFFSANKMPPEEPQEHPALTQLKTIDPDNLSPRAAWDLIAELVSLIKN